ncbi:MAG: triose-phosphate isomerase [Candidatus Liptonbacteria bacterium RIFOXYB1_FULL_36_10]|uniref:Triosephosphate isomerase n=3 Tax=Candidatus Liptoniibacteriota TaxID=1817909 RepID=A0A1G2CLJ9_9BACT|nr:MAG: triose-phosphate isomerase [Candidatus Liptonbacteria bacterium RIFOXYB1_FULL_36_10]OGZ03928.1 MAG: triose-phosphate isomerase [Candidatus Liptonbacteria bacterium RIFOXYD1_FULL_36_11]
MEKPILAFNWKMNPASEKEAISIFKEVQKGISFFNGKTLIFPPFIFLSKLAKLRGVKNNPELGSQNVFWEEKGAYTGEISPVMIKNIKGEWVIIGHSERRKLGDTDEIVSKKIFSSLAASLKFILCVGENKKMPQVKAEAFIFNQLKSSLSSVEKIKAENWKSKIIIAYEPIWAIGTGENASPEYAEIISQSIKKFFSTEFNFLPKILYGGSVNSENISSFLKLHNINGVLIGGASLRPDEIKKIMKLSGDV